MHAKPQGGVLVAILFSLVATATSAQVWTKDSSFHPNVIKSQSALDRTRFIPARDGRVLMVGNFTHAQDGAIAAPGIAFLNADGSVDSTFHTSLDVGYTSVNDALPLADGRVLVVTATSAFEEPIVCTVSRLRADGSNDPAFSAITQTGDCRLTRLASGQIVFWTQSTWSFYPPPLTIRRLNADGTPAGPGVTLPSEYSTINSFAAQADGRLILSVYRLDPTTQAYSGRLLRLTPTDGIDPTFSAQPTSHPYRSVAVASDGKVIAAYDNRLVRLNVDGSVDSTFAAAFPGVAEINFVEQRADGSFLLQASSDGDTPRVDVLLVAADGTIQSRVSHSLADDQWVQLAGERANGDLLILHSKTGRGQATLTACTAGGTRLGDLDPGLVQRSPGLIWSSATDPQSRFLVFGDFNEVDGIPTNGAIRFHPDGTLDDSFHCTAPFDSRGILVVGDDGSVLLHDTRFEAVGDVNRYIDVAHRIGPDGTVLATFDIIDGAASWYAMTADHRTLISRYAANSTGAYSFKLLWLDPTGAVLRILPTKFESAILTPAPGTAVMTLPTTVSDPVRFAQPLPEGTLLIGGSFEKIDGVPRRLVARLLADGTLDPTYAPVLPAFQSYAELEPPDARHRVVVTGIVGAGATTQRESVRVLADGSIDPSFLSLPTWPAHVLAHLENGLPDVNFNPAASTYVQAPDGTRWTAGPFGRYTSCEVATITQQPIERGVNRGDDATFYVVLGTSQSASYQWYHDGLAISGATSPLLTIAHVSPGDAGGYAVQVHVSGVDVRSAEAPLVVLGGAGAIVNFSALVTIPGAGNAIGGFTLAGAGSPRKWLIRAMAEGLRPFGITRPLPGPELWLHEGSGGVTYAKGYPNDIGLSTTAEVGAFPPLLSPYGWPLPGWPMGDSAILKPLSIGSYTMTVSSSENGEGTALLEVYDTATTGASNGLKNVSLRMRVAADNPRATVGFVIGGPTPARVLIRGIGPTLASFGVSSVLADPQLTLYRGNGDRIGSNGGWAGDPTIATSAQHVGAFALPTTSHDSALVATLPPGAYTATVNSGSGAIGETLVELYLLEAAP